MSENQEAERTGRKKWDMTVFEERAKEKKAAEEAEGKIIPNERKKAGLGTVVQRVALQRRSHDVDIYKSVGKFNLVTNTTELSQKGGFYCETCECLLKDSSSYLDHINGKKHQKLLGMTMRPERATLSEVQDRLEYYKRKKAEEDVVASRRDIEERIEKLDSESSKRKRKKHKSSTPADAEAPKENEEVNEDAEEDDMAAMGFNFSFGGSKKQES